MMKESLMKAQRRFNFLSKKGIKKDVEKVHVFYEDCKNCPEKDECPNREDMEMEGIILTKLHEMMEEMDLDSELHPLTSEDNGELGELVCEEGGVMPVSTIMHKETPIFSPENNFLVVELEDGKKYLYTTELDVSDDSDDVKAPLMFR